MKKSTVNVKNQKNVTETTQDELLTACQSVKHLAIITHWYKNEHYTEIAKAAEKLAIPYPVHAYLCIIDNNQVKLAEQSEYDLVVFSKRANLTASELNDWWMS